MSKRVTLHARTQMQSFDWFTRPYREIALNFKQNCSKQTAIAATAMQDAAMATIKKK